MSATGWEIALFRAGRAMLAVAALGLASPASTESADLAPQTPAGSEAKVFRVVVVPLGKVAPDLVEHVARSVRERFDFEVEVVERTPLPPWAWYKPRKRWRAEKLLDFLDTLDVGPARRVIGFTEAPISTTKGSRHDWGIAGLGQMPGRSCVLTSHLFRRYKHKARKRYLRLMENLVLHELGHTLGLPHCPLDRCIMADAKGNAIRAGKLSINEFCPRCHEGIRELLRDPALRGDWKDDEWKLLRARGWTPYEELREAATRAARSR